MSSETDCSKNFITATCSFDSGARCLLKAQAEEKI